MKSGLSLDWGTDVKRKTWTKQWSAVSNVLVTNTQTVMMVLGSNHVMKNYCHLHGVVKEDINITQTLTMVLGSNRVMKNYCHLHGVVKDVSFQIIWWMTATEIILPGKTENQVWSVFVNFRFFLLICRCVKCRYIHCHSVTFS